MRLFSALVSLFVVVACSSSTDEEDCPIVGTYAVLGVVESGNCPDPGSSAVTYTISSAPTGYEVEIQGLQGACTAEQTGACKAQGKCDVLVSDAKDPRANRGTFQFAWTFTASGFSGVATVAIPDADSLPGGCTGTAKQTATRR